MQSSRSRWTRRFAVGGVLAALALAALSGPAVAQEPTLTSATAAPGGGEDVSGSGCVARATVQIQFDGVVVLTTRATATGSFRAHIVIPVSVVPGSHRVTVVCARVNGGTTAESSDVTVTLATTGSASSRDATVASILLVLGAGLILAAGVRRREVVPVVARRW